MQAPSGSCEGARGSHERYKMRDAAVGLGEDFGAGGVPVGLPVSGIAVLVGVKVTVGRGVVDGADSALSAVGTLFSGREDEFCAVGAKDAFALGRCILGQAEFDLVPQMRAD